jgi:hypothetical protein
LSIVGCSVSLPISRSKPKDPGIWSLSRIVLWSKEKRSNLKQIKAWVKINVISEEGKNGFDAFLILNNDGEGRIEALGPWRSPIFCIVFNPDFVYLYIYNESTLYFGNNKPDYIQRLAGLPLDFFRLFDSLVSNLPEYLSHCSGSFSEEGDHPLLYMDCEEQGRCFKARIMIRDFPVVEEVAWIGEKKYENFLVKYFDLGVQDGYAFPKTVHFQWPEGQECLISFISLKVNQPVSKDTFEADETWFQGKVINLEDLDP